MTGTVDEGIASTVLGRLDLQEGVSAAWPSSGRTAAVLVRPEQIEVRGPLASTGDEGIPARVVPTGLSLVTTPCCGWCPQSSATGSSAGAGHR